MDTLTGRWRWRSSPLLRPSDIAERWIRVATVLLMAVLAPVAGTMAAHGVETGMSREGRDWHPATATLVTDAAPVVADRTPGAETVTTQAPVRWDAPGHTTRSAVVQVPQGAKAGSTVRVWVDARGLPHHRPPSASQTDTEGGVTGAGVAGGICLLLLGARLVTVRVTLDRWRDRAWEREWSQVEPLWSHRIA
ncbi:hypothetical protein ACIHFE_33565 [Streptomyces sp. NPDC052396]|uniref:Rv1733c family protein n=1 Tax=Streptomyces sp. NPDC052396 TaxID=3365689 RepID=UPI0037D05D15